MALRSVAVVLQEPVSLFEFGVLAEVFGIDRTDDGVPPFDFRVCAERPGPVAARNGVGLTAAARPRRRRRRRPRRGPRLAERRTPSPAVVEVLRGAVERGAWVLSVCSGVFSLGGGRASSTGAGAPPTGCTPPTRRSATRLARVDPDVLYVHDGTVITSAGTAAGIDACLHLVRTELGSAVATRIARRMVVPPHRDGGQRQFVDRPVPATTAESLGEVLTHMLEHLEQPHSVEDLARRATMSPRTFARRFVAETGTTPHQWLTDQRVLRARELLELTELSVEGVARESGFGSAALLRHHFTRCTGVTPTTFRRQHRIPA